MQLQIDKLGKVAITVEESHWSLDKDYDRLTVVEAPNNEYKTYISRKPVPAGTVLTNREYWIPFSSLKEEIVIDFNSFVSSLTEAMQQTKDYTDGVINQGIEDITAIKEEAMRIITYIADNGIDSTVLAPNSINSEKIQANAVIAGKIAPNAVVAGNIAANAVIEGNIAPNAVVAGNIAPETVTGSNIAEKTIDATRIKDKTIAGINIKDRTIGTDQLSGGMYNGVMTPPCITTEKIADWQPDSEDETGITTEKIADSAVTEAKIANNAVTADKLSGVNDAGGAAVTEDKLAPGAVTTEKLATPVITQLQTIMDSTPTPGSEKPVNSGGVFNSVISTGVFDLSAHTGDSYASLSAALTAMNALSTAYKKGGMSIKYVQSSDNNSVYVQYMLTKQIWSNDTADWQKVNLEKELSQLSQKIMSPRITIQSGKYIDSNGEPVDNANCSITDYIEVDNGMTIAFVNTFTSPNTQQCVAYYNESKQKVDEFRLYNYELGEVQLVIPYKVKYVRVSIFNLRIDSFYFSILPVNKVDSINISNLIAGRFEYIDNVYIYSDGNEISNSNFVSTDYIPAFYVDEIEFYNTCNGQPVYAVIYNKSKTPVSVIALRTQENGIYRVNSIPKGSYYIRISIFKKHIANFFVSINSDFYVLKHQEVFNKLIVHNPETNYIDRNSDGWVDNAIINDEGSTTKVTGFYATPFFAVSERESYYFYHIHTGYYAFYDENQDVIEAHGNDNSLENPFTPPTGAKFMRATAINSIWRNDCWVFTSDGLPPNYKEMISPDYIPGGSVNVFCNYDGNEIATFNKIACVGDSLTAGTFNHNEGGTEEYLVDSKYSYPTYLKKIAGVDCVNLGIGGNTSAQWYNHYENEDLSGYDAVIVQLGVNDAIQNHGWTQESITAFTNIISKFKQDNDGIKVFVATIIPAISYSGTAFDSVSQGIRDLVSSLADTDVVLIDMALHGNTGSSTAFNAGHLTAYGYYRLAQDYKGIIGYYMNSNKSQFRFVQFIGTNYEYNG